MNTSQTGGPLTPLTAPLLGQGLARLFQQLIVGVTGLDGTLVRPRWQAEPANIPQFGVAWCAVGIQKREAQGFAWQTPDTPTGQLSLSRQEELTLLCSFYDNGVGQAADQYALSLRDGLQLGQNREVFFGTGIDFINAGELRALPSLLKERWLYRVDIPLYFRRTMTWTYAITTLTGANAVVESETPGGTLTTTLISLP